MDIFYSVYCYFYTLDKIRAQKSKCPRYNKSNNSARDFCRLIKNKRNVEQINQLRNWKEMAFSSRYQNTLKKN